MFRFKSKVQTHSTRLINLVRVCCKSTWSVSGQPDHHPDPSIFSNTMMIWWESKGQVDHHPRLFRITIFTACVYICIYIYRKTQAHIYCADHFFFQIQFYLCTHAYKHVHHPALCSQGLSSKTTAPYTWRLASWPVVQYLRSIISSWCSSERWRVQLCQVERGYGSRRIDRWVYSTKMGM